MEPNEAIKDIMEERKVTKAAMARMLGLTSGTVGNQLNGRTGMNLSTVLSYLGELGYELVFVPRGSRLPSGSYVIEPGTGE